MTISQSIAAALALFATVLAIEGVTRGGTKQLVAGLLFGLAAALTFSFGDALSTLNLQMIDPLPRWRDVAHPLPVPKPTPAPVPEPAPAPKPQVTAPATTTVVATAYAINFHPSQSPNGIPRFLAVYPREKFMDKTNWAAAPIPALGPMYDALLAHDWQEADSRAESGLEQLTTSDLPDKTYYQAHLIWVRGIATMEMGKPDEAASLFDKAAKIISDENSDADDVRRFRIDREIVDLYDGRADSVLAENTFQEMKDQQKFYAQEIALLVYSYALRGAANSAYAHSTNALDNQQKWATFSNARLESAKKWAYFLSKNGDSKAASRLLTILLDPFGLPGHNATVAALSKIETERLPSSAHDVCVICVVNYHPTISNNGYPRFLAIYPFEKMFELSKWKTPEQPFLKPLYRALHGHDWSLADIKAQEGLDQLANSDIPNKYYYEAHLTWARGIAIMELGKPADAAKIFDEAAKLLTYGNTSSYDVMRFQIDREIVNIYAGRPNSIFMRDLMPDLLVSEDTHQQEIALLHYARALRAAKDGLGDVTNNELQAAKDVADRMSQMRASQQAGRVMTILNDPFGGVGREKMYAAVAKYNPSLLPPAHDEAPIKQVTASPHYYPVYPREVFMSDVDWKNPAVPELVPIYDALEKGDWQGAIALNYNAIQQADTLPEKDVRYYRGHILWLWAIAKLESGDPIRAAGILSQARVMITYPRTDNSDKARMMIDTALFSDFVNVPSHNLPYQVEGRNSQDQAMFHYAKALYYKGSGDNYYVDVHLNEAKAIVADMDMRGLHDEAARLRSVFAAQFPNN